MELIDVKLNTLLKELPEILEQLKKYYYLLDLDIRQYFAGIFNKIEMSNYLIDHFNFCLEGECKKDCNIVNSNYTVEIECLTRLKF